MRYTVLLPLILLGLAGCVRNETRPAPASTTYVTPAPQPAPSTTTVIRP
jgi:hypothetical protein